MIFAVLLEYLYNRDSKLISLKMPFCLQLIYFLKIILRIKHTFIIINVFRKVICVEYKKIIKNQHNLGFLTFKLPASTKLLLWLTS